MRSLRARLGLALGVATAMLVLVASVLVVRQDWLRAEALLPDEVSAEAETADRVAAMRFHRNGELGLTKPGGESFVAAFDESGSLIESDGAAEETLAEAAGVLEVGTIGPFAIAIDEVGVGSETWVVAAIGCSDQTSCATILVGRPRQSFAEYLVARLGWVLGPAIVFGLLAALAARFTVGRSLRPVEEMRSELDDIAAEHLDRRVPVPRTGDELQSLGESFNRTIDRLASAVDAQRRFSADAAHELRSPLAGVRATLEVGRTHPEGLDRAVDESLVQLDRVTRLLDDLLLLARREAEPATLRARVTDLDDLVATEVNELQLRRPGVEVDRRQVEPVQAEVDPAGMRRVIVNLLDNAADHARQKILVRLGWAGADTWRLAVDDDGPGVSPEDRERIFERFTRLDQSRDRSRGGSGGSGGSSGLGLAIARDLVEAHGGTVEVTGSDLGGASFVVTVPRVPR